MWGLLALGLAGGALMAGEPAPLMVWVIWSAYMALVGWTLIQNPIHGMRLTRTTLTFGLPERTISMKDIDRLQIEEWSDSTDFILHLTDGTRINMGSVNVPSLKKTRRIFEDHGVPVTTV